MKLLALFLLALTASSAQLSAETRSSARCTKPVISSVSATATSNSLTIGWNTKTPSSSQVVISSNWNGYNAGKFSPVADGTTGTTTHSVTVMGLIPSTKYAYGVISQGVNGTGTCGTSYQAIEGGGDSDQLYQATQAAPAGPPNTFGIGLFGQQHVARGFGAWIGVNVYTTQGAIPNSTLKVVVTGLPSNVALSWYSGAGVPQMSTTRVTNDTWNVYQVNSQANASIGTAEFNLVTNSSGGVTPPGTYTLTFTGSGSGLRTVVATYQLTVDSFPFSTSAFPSGTPASYPPIPCLDSSSRTMSGKRCASNWTDSMWTYGAFNCRQDMDPGADPSPYTAKSSPPISACKSGVRCVAPNHPGNLCIISGAITNCAWFYDGMHVYQAIATHTGQQSLWQQCINNVKNLYVPYVNSLRGHTQGYVAFSEGIYEDWRRTRDPNDKTALDGMANLFSGYPQNALMIPVEGPQREAAYALKSLLYDGLAGGTPVNISMNTYGQSLNYWVDHVLEHIDEVCWSQNATYYEYFMFGLEAQALLRYYDNVSHDARILPAIKCIADFIWTNGWNKVTGDPNTFPYDSFRGQLNLVGSSTMGLNQLLSPMYARLFKETGLTQYQTEADTIWQAGILMDVDNSYGAGNGPPSNSGKIFSQNWYWATDFVAWRSPPSQVNSPGVQGPRP